MSVRAEWTQWICVKPGGTAGDVFPLSQAFSMPGQGFCFVPDTTGTSSSAEEVFKNEVHLDRTQAEHSSDPAPGDSRTGETPGRFLLPNIL